LDDRIYYKEAKTLQAAGHQLSMICRADETGVFYDMGNTIPLNNPSEKVIDFEGIPAYPIASPFNLFDKTLKKVFRGKFYTNYIQQAIEIDADVYHAHEPESFYIGLQIAKKTGAKVLFDSHESFTTGTSKEIWIKNKYLKDITYLITANEITRGYLLSLNNTLKSEVIYNASQSHLFNKAVSANKPVGIVIAHDGYLPFNRGLKEMLIAFKNVNASYPEVKFKIVGATTGEEKIHLLAFVKANKLINVIEETGWLPYNKVAEALANCSIGIIAKTPTVNNTIGGPPIKYFNYTAAGMAIIDVDMPETTRLMAKYKNGLSVSNQSVEGLTKAMFNLIEQPELLAKYKANSIIAFKQLNWENEGEKLVAFYANIVLNKSNIIAH
jgi:hypothetical protein